METSTDVVGRQPASSAGKHPICRHHAVSSRHEEALMAIDPDAFMAFVHRFAADLGATAAAGNVIVGHERGLSRALPGQPATAAELGIPSAGTTRCHPVTRRL